MLTREHQQEYVSKAFARAVAAAAGVLCDEPTDYGVDLNIESVWFDQDGQRHCTGHILQVQLKSATNADFDDEGNLVYDLDVANYNALVRTDRGSPLILVVYRMPAADAQWVNVTEERTRLERCGYWASLKGEPRSANLVTQRIRIPRTQRFDPAALRRLMVSVQRGEDL